MDVINQTWSPMYELKNVFDVFLPQLLMYPNPSDPLNGEAAHLMMTNKDKFDETVSRKLLKYFKAFKPQTFPIGQEIRQKVWLTRAHR